MNPTATAQGVTPAPARAIPKRRVVALAIVVSTALYLRALLVSWFFTRPFLMKINGRPCLRERPYVLPRAPYFKVARMKWLWFRKIWTRQDHAAAMKRLDEKYSRLVGEVEDYVEAHGAIQTREIPIPEYDWRNGTPEDFHRRFVVTPMPVVLRGFALESEAVRHWNFDYIVDKCGEVEVNLTSPEADWVGQLKQVRDPNVYCANADAPFKQFPELVAELGVDRLAPYLNRKNTQNQFFIGRKATGSGYHCAGIWNFFHMIEGEKKWTFVDPELTWMIYPWITIAAVAFASLVNFPNQVDLSLYRLYQYCPRYSVHLQRGDVLFNPPWWWHAVDNLTPTSVAVATRWDAMRRDISFHELNRILSLMAIFNPKFPRFLFEYLSDAVANRKLVLKAGAGAFDEDVKLESRNQVSREVNQYQGRVVERVRARLKW